MPTRALPKGPKSALPQLFHLKDPFPYMDRLLERYSSPMTCPLLGQAPMVITWDPEGIEAVLSAPPDTFGSGTAEALATLIGKGSLFLMSGERHKRARKLLMPPFHGERMRSYAGVIQQATLRWLDKRALGVSGAILPLAQGITLDVIVEAVFGERDPDRVASLHEGILGLVRAFNPLVATWRPLQRDFGGLGPWAKLQRRAAGVRAAIDRLLIEKRAQPGADILSLLLAARDENDQALSDSDIYEQLLTFVVAGHETTATTLSWALYELHRHPSELDELKAELRGALGSGPEALAALPYLDAVVSETLRRHPPVPIVPRRALREFRLGQYELAAGQSVGLGVYMCHSDPKNYPEPRAFLPERFVGKSRSPFLYLPFGGGARRCLGAAFANYELKVALGTLLERATFSLDEPKPVANAFRIGTFGPDTGIRMTRLT